LATTELSLLLRYEFNPPKTKYQRFYWSNRSLTIVLSYGRDYRKSFRRSAETTIRGIARLVSASSLVVYWCLAFLMQQKNSTAIRWSHVIRARPLRRSLAREISDIIEGALLLVGMLWLFVTLTEFRLDLIFWGFP